MFSRVQLQLQLNALQKLNMDLFVSSANYMHTSNQSVCTPRFQFNSLQLTAFSSCDTKLAVQPCVKIQKNKYLAITNTVILCSYVLFTYDCL